MTIRSYVPRLSVLLLLLSSLLPALGHADASELAGQWYRAEKLADGSSYRYAKTAALPLGSVAQTDHVSLTGGTYYYQADFEIAADGTYVVDFRSSTTIGSFRHFVFDARGRLIAERAGGIERAEENPFLMRHGRELALGSGHYRLITELDSPFLLAVPEPFVQPLAAYRRDIKAGNALALGGLGVLCGLGLYYFAIALSRRRVADMMYVLFILGNVLYNGSALLLFSDLFDLHWFYLVSVPILFSNAAYVIFVVALLEIDARSQPLLYRTAQLALAMLGCFAIAAALHPHWSLEFDRYGVALLVTYGFVAALVRARHGHSSARWYLVASSAFFLLGGLAISLERFEVRALSVEHIGLLAVVVEAALLALVLAHQLAILHSEKALAERRAREGFQIAYRDALTGLPNRYSLETALAELPPEGSLTFIDLDGLKHYNDQYGHSRGDELLRGFATALDQRIGQRAAVYRLSGDEFAVLSKSGEVDFVSDGIESAIQALQRGSFKIAGASFGSVFAHEDPRRENLKHIADTRMYEHKRVRRASGPAEWLRSPSSALADDSAERALVSESRDVRNEA